MGEATYDNLVDELVDQDEVSAKVLFFEDAAEIMDAPHNGTKKL